MKRNKVIFCLGFVLCILFSLTVFVEATGEIESKRTGLVEVQVKVPAGFINPVFIKLDHDGESFTIKTGVENGYQASQEVAAGSYFPYLDIMPLEDESCPTCAGGSLAKEITARYPTKLVVLKDGINPFRVVIIDPEAEEEELEVGGNIEEETEPPEETTEDVEEIVEEKKKNFTRMLTEKIIGDEPVVHQQKESFGKRLFKKNFVTLIMLVILCIISIFVELKKKL